MGPTTGALHNHHHHHSHPHHGEVTLTSTPPPLPLSKRDKRRGALSDKLNELTASFSQNRDMHYRQQLQSLQVDMNLVMRADPYADSPLDDSGEDIASLVAASMGGIPHASFNGGGFGLAGNRRLDPDTAPLAGRWYAQFVEEANNAAEERDAALTMLEHKHERSLHELHATNRYKMQLAQEEHRQLSRTLRERLIQTIAQKKSRLMREKEQLDIADSNALLLHPSQFSITNPASPGGVPNNRKTRHSRQRPGEADDVGAGFSGGDGSQKRKRKAGGDMEDGDGPVPVGRAMEGGTASPFRDARARLTATQVEAPLYSVERLFTEKELAMHLNHAHVAAHNFFADLKAQANGTADGPMVKADDDDAVGLGDAATAPEGEAEEETALAAPEMERGANQSHHATRSTRNGATSSLALLGDVAGSERNGSLTSSAPLILPSTFVSKTGVVPPPTVLRSEDADDDLAKMDRLMRAAPSATDQKLLDSLCGSLSSAPYPSGPLSTTRGVYVSGAPAAAGGVAMSAQSSMAGFSEIGGVPMSRYDEGSSMGAPMRRSASGAGRGHEAKRSRMR
ncbi:MAG: hypothetical protein M1838_001385 [Thelocarpon superellum]|nr:MAG: hypothetical protein M1838_001385 [Thelocarpon superellum]